MILVAVAGIAVLLSVDLGGDDLVAGDEGYYGVMARNVSSSVQQLVSPSLSPLGPPGDKPFLYPLVLAGAIGLGGVHEVPLRLVNVALSVLAAVFLYLIGQSLGNRLAGLWAALLWLTSPMLADVARRVAAEPLVVALSLVGVWSFLRAVNRKRWPYALAAGVLFGLAFLSKLWLALIPAVAVTAGSWFANLVAPKPKRRAWPAWWKLALVALSGFIVTASAQLVMCWLITPQYFDHWMRVYLGFSLSGRVGGAGFAGYWHKPSYYYVAAVAGQAVLCIPMLGLGAIALVRRRGGASQPRLAPAVLLLWLAALIPMSAPAVKASIYVAPVLPAVFLLAGYGVSSLASHVVHSEFSRRELYFGTTLAILGSAVSFAVLSHGGEKSVLALATALGVQVTWVASVLLSGASLRRGKSLAALTLAGCLSIAVAGGMGEQLRTVTTTDHVTGFARIARAVGPGLRSVDPRQLCFISPEWASLSFYTFRTGRYWESPYVKPDPGLTLAALRGSEPFFFVVTMGGTELYGGCPSPQILETISAEAHRLDLGSDFPAEIRVFANEPLFRALSGLGSGDHAQP